MTSRMPRATARRATNGLEGCQRSKHRKDQQSTSQRETEAQEGIPFAFFIRPLKDIEERLTAALFCSLQIDTLA